MPLGVLPPLAGPDQSRASGNQQPGSVGLVHHLLFVGDCLEAGENG